VLGRPNLYTTHAQEGQLLPTGTKKLAAAIAIVVLFLMPFHLPVINQIPFVRFLGDGDWLRPVTTALIFLIAALGLNILVGYAGQVSIGHAFFMGVGAYTAAFLGGESGETLYGLGLPLWIWLPGAGIGAALVGMLVAPVAVRLRGLYLAIVTLGLVFVGIHMGNMSWGRRFAGDPGLGRQFPSLDIRLWKEEQPLITVADKGQWLWFDVSKAQKSYLFILVIALIMLVLAANLARTRTGRALQAIRDRDVAAEIMGIPEFKYKLMAFAISSFFAGIGGALLASLIGKLPAAQWNLFLSVQFIAILLIGGAGTVAGTVFGTIFVILSPPLIEQVSLWLGRQAEADGVVAKLAEVLLTKGPGDFGGVATSAQAPGWPLNIFGWNVVLYGVLIIVFLIFEPLGLYGIWLKLKSYFQRWPFSY